MASRTVDIDLAALRSTFYDYILEELNRAAPELPSSCSIEQLLGTARNAARDAFADFAERWNHNNIGAIAERLPPEILVMCVSHAPFDALVTASHVSRKWRALLLSERSLWARFIRAGRSDSTHNDDARMLSQLAVMLGRSRPVPFILQLPYLERGCHRYADRLVDLLRSDFSRMQHYNGLFYLYERLDGYDTSMHHLRLLRLVSSSHSSSRTIFRIPRNWATRIAPNIRHLDLVSASLSIPHGCHQLLSLIHLKISADIQPDYHDLFYCCPNLVSLELRDVEDASMLPPGPLPQSLVSVSLVALEGRSTQFEIHLARWSAYPIRKLTTFSVASLAPPLDHFPAFCPSLLKVEMLRNRVEVTQCTPTGGSLPGSQWCCVVYPFSWNGTNQLLALDGDCAARLTSLSVSLAHFKSLFTAQLTTPQLVRLTFMLDAGSGSAHSVPPMPPNPTLYIAAPHLRDLAVYVPGNSFFIRGDTVYRAAAGALRLHLRALVRFDAQKLQCITVRGSQPVIAALGCGELARYAVEYVEDYGSA